MVKTILVALLSLAATSLLAQTLSPQTSLRTLPQPAPTPPGLSSSGTTLLFFGQVQPTHPWVSATNLFLGTNRLGFVPLVISSNLLTSSTPVLPKPGIYLANPHSAIVIVPGPHVDDSCIVRLGGADSQMVLPTPNLKLIPWAPK